MSRAVRRDRGAGSVLVLSAIMVVVVAFLVVTTLAAGYASRHRAAAAADLAALAAAEELRVAGGDPCSAAERVSRANGAAVRECEVNGWEVEVVVAAAANGPLRWLDDPARRARAGVEPDPGGVPGDWIVPVAGDYHITARFGEPGPHWESGRHTGLDFAAPTGTPVVAVAPGRVTHAGPAGPYGNLVAVDHGTAVTYYTHLAAVGVEVGEAVDAAQRVGTVGATGNATGPHLHFEVRVDGVPQDPAVVLSSVP
ncbi:MAG TPA: Rv3654c family TadE-like protein [Jiangellaceae bacterium]|nr:Rv3654c family TadE-like protein [Jiangellaceae bacterium]